MPNRYIDVLLYLEHILVYSNEIFSDLAKWPNISICICTSVHIFKIWNYDCFRNNIFRFLNDIFRCFVSLTISRTYFNIFEWEFVRPRKVAKQSKCVLVYAYVCVCGYMFVFMFMFVCMCTHVCMHLYVFVSFPMFCLSCNLVSMFRYIRMRFSAISQSGQTFQSTSINLYIFGKFYGGVWNNNFKCLNDISDVLLLLQFREHNLVYTNEILSDPESRQSSICIHTTVHNFKIWNFDCVSNNIFKCPNDTPLICWFYNSRA